MNNTPIEVPLIERDKQELVEIIGRYKEELQWYVDERNRLIAGAGEATVTAPQEFREHFKDRADYWSRSGGLSFNGANALEGWLAARLSQGAQTDDGAIEALRELTLLISNMANLYDLKGAHWLMRQPAYRNALGVIELTGPSQGTKGAK